jgi:exoribonuclease-2
MHKQHTIGRSELSQIAAQAMLERGLAPEFPASVYQELNAIKQAGHDHDQRIVDMTQYAWCSIDNDDSLDLDQLTVGEMLPNGLVKIWVAVADVDVLVPQGSALDAHAKQNTTSVYTSTRIFPMLPERLSTDLTSLNPHQDRLAVVIEMHINPEAEICHSEVYRAKVCNHAKLAYDAVSSWLNGQAALPEAAASFAGMDAQLHLQDNTAQLLRQKRHEQGALEFETFQPKAVFEGEHVVAIEQQVHNRARQLIEEFMIAANTCTAHFLAERGGASLRRVVRSPERWQRIVDVAQSYGYSLPQDPDSKALETFLAKRRAIDPVRFPDLSLVIIKLMGSGEYVVENTPDMAIGHFGLSVRDYTHSTAPNRRYPDLITQRMIKGWLIHGTSPYTTAELQALATHCTQQEDAARKVERRLRKSEAALMLVNQVGHVFDAVVTGKTPSGTWVRVFSPPAEGMLVSWLRNVEVGELLRVQLVSANVEQGFIDFEQIHADTQASHRH